MEEILNSFSVFKIFFIFRTSSKDATPSNYFNYIGHSDRGWAFNQADVEWPNGENVNDSSSRFMFSMLNPRTTGMHLRPMIAF
jgi:hypothetical protein